MYLKSYGSPVFWHNYGFSSTECLFKFMSEITFAIYYNLYVNLHKPAVQVNSVCEVPNRH